MTEDGGGGYYLHMPEPTPPKAAATRAAAGPAAAPAAPAPVMLDPVKEVRLALVLYGGVSLAIYMNGVAQELYHLVRATAPLARGGEEAKPDAALSGTERVYRTLGRLLGSGKALAAVRPSDPIRTRFVIDILSGSSAGGINGIFLAKALANDQSIERLRTLWVDEGDIGVLLNDKRSTKDTELHAERPPVSLLNGNRMYWKLLEAFESMEPARRSRGDDSSSPYVEELDLFVTTTDLEGVTLPIRLANTVAYEKRYRNVYHFVYATADATGQQRNDFHADNNPFLAFSARCTSSLPFAFRPTVLAETDRILSAFPAYAGRPDIRSDRPDWRAFYPDYVQSEDGGPPPTTLPLPFPLRSFGDGGALDNKPFSYATQSLMRRRADLPVERKLIYIEPDPGHPEMIHERTSPPNAIENSERQGLLPREESIREDIQAVQERNRLLERIDRLLGYVDRDVDVGAATSRGQPQGGPEGGRAPDADARWTPEEIGRRGIGFGAYLRLRIGDLTDDLAALITRVAGFVEDSDQSVAIAEIVRTWRNASYRDPTDDGGDAAGEHPLILTLLTDLDIKYPLRRMAFVKRKIHVALDNREPWMVLGSGREVPDPGAYLDELRGIDEQLSRRAIEIRSAGRRARARQGSPVQAQVAALELTPERLGSLLQGTPAERTATLQTFARDHIPQLEALRAALAGALRPALSAAGGDLGTGKPGPAREAARRVVRAMQDAFEDYDSVAFPIRYGTDGEETSVVEIFRISPLDATSLIDESPSSSSGRRRRKLAGIALGHYGAFLERPWRQNDIMWGRLDAAECLIRALAPPNDDGLDDLVKEAQLAIIRDELQLQDRGAIARAPVAPAAGPAPAADPGETPEAGTAGRAVPAWLSAPPEDPDLDARAVQVWNYLRTGYEVDRKLPPRVALDTMARATHVAGGVLKGVAGTGPLASPAAWVSRVGALLTGLVEVATNGSMWHLATRHVLSLLYTFELLAIVLGLVLGVQPAQQLGVTALAVTLLAHLLIAVTGGVLRERRWVRAVVAGLVALVVAVLFYLSFLELRHVRDDVPILHPLRTPTPTASASR